MEQPSFWLVLDQNHDGLAESVLPSCAKTRQRATTEGLEHCDGRLMGVVSADEAMAYEDLCLQCSLNPLQL